MLNLNNFAKEVHRVAVEHGWYDGQETRGTDEIIALIHSEWSEALEEYRAGRPNVWFGCRRPDEADSECTLSATGVCGLGTIRAACEYWCEKPEGIMIELIDGCIRILDFLGFKGKDVSDKFDTLEKLSEVAERAEYDCFEKSIKEHSLPELVRWLHWYTAQYDMDEDMDDPMCALMEAMGIVFVWIKGNGGEPEDLLRMKHEYNKTRPYKHGGKRC